MVCNWQGDSEGLPVTYTGNVNYLYTKMINYTLITYTKQTKCTITTVYNYMGQESWHSGYMDKGNEKYKNDYCQNVLKNDSISISLVWILFQ